MARPKLYRNPAKLTLSLERSSLSKLTRLAFQSNLSRSQLLARWIDREADRKQEPAATK